MEISRFAVIFAVIFMAGCMGSDDADVCTDDATKLTKTEETALASNTFNYIRLVYLIPNGLEGEFGSVEEYKDFYVINFTFGGAGMLNTPALAYVSSEGKLFAITPLGSTQNMINQISDTNYIPETPAPEQTRATVDIDDDYCLGSDDAPVTIIEFSDYQCPVCQTFWAQVLPQIKSEYIDTGQVKFIYRDLPLDFHPNAQKAAEATECAGDEEKFWDMHDKIFEGQGAWSGGDADSIFKGYASELELDEDAFADCLDTGKYTEEVQKDYQDGVMAIGGASTPAFFINGIFVGGISRQDPFSTFKIIIDAEIAEGGASSTITGNCTGK